MLPFQELPSLHRVVLALLAGVLIVPLAALAQTQPDFSGTWTMDPSRSESAHQDVPIGAVSLVIRQTVADFSVETRRTQSKRSSISSETLKSKLDGTESVNTGLSGIEIKVKAHWAGPKLIVETAREMNGSTITTMQTFELGANGNEITIQKTLTVQHGYQGPGAPRSTGSGTDVFVRRAPR